MTLEYAAGEDEFMSDLDGMDALINKEVPSQAEEYFWEDPYQGLPDSLEMYNVYNMLVPWSALNGRYLATDQCARGVEQNRRRLEKEELR